MESTILAAKQYPVRNELKVPLTEDQVLEALGKLKRKKAAGKNGILPEMVKGCGGWMMDYILDLFSMCGRRKGSLRSGEMPCWCLYQRREI